LFVTLSFKLLSSASPPFHDPPPPPSCFLEWLQSYDHHLEKQKNWLLWFFDNRVPWYQQYFVCVVGRSVLVLWSYAWRVAIDRSLVASCSVSAALVIARVDIRSLSAVAAMARLANASVVSM
jgi:hypothetical protein